MLLSIEYAGPAIISAMTASTIFFVIEYSAQRPRPLRSGWKCRSLSAAVAVICVGTTGQTQMLTGDSMDQDPGCLEFERTGSLSVKQPETGPFAQRGVT